ncbi:MAG: pseudouridine synthase [Gammaproteobacteria bacterium]|nr:pseudouridine synthase [Gammaproteobacteria bacterium]
MSERIQKVLSRLGVGSRRQIESWIREGKIQINKKPAQLGDHIDITDRVYVSGKKINLEDMASVERRVIMYYKNEGEICSRNDPEHKDSVFDHLPKLDNGRWISIGRLDLNTCGLLLFSTDGELANRLMHPSFEIEREYASRVLGEVPQQALDNMLSGVECEDDILKFDTITDAGGTGANHWYHVTLHQGRYREVRRLWESQDIKVSRLKRVRYGTISLPRTLRQGTWEELNIKQINTLLDITGMETVKEKKFSHQEKAPGKNRTPSPYNRNNSRKKTKKRH